MASSKKHHAKDGLRLRGNVYWTRDPRDGKERSTGCKDRPLARAVRSEWEKQAVDPRYAASQNTTVADMIADALEGKRHRKGRVSKTLTSDTMQFYKSRLGQVARYFEVDAPIAKIDYDSVGAYMHTRLSEPGARTGRTLHPHTLHDELMVLRYALHRQKRHGNYQGDPDYVTRKGEFSAAYEPEKRALAWGEIPKLLTALAYGAERRVIQWTTVLRARELHTSGLSVADVARKMGVVRRTAVRYLAMPLVDPRADGLAHAQAAAWIIATAARVSEMRRATTPDHDLVTWRVFMRGTKSRKARGWIPIAPPFRRFLEFALHGRPKTGTLFAYWKNINRVLVVACKRAGIPRVSPNDLRRTHLNLLSEAGINNSTLKGVSRHSTTRMLDEVYTRTDIEAVEHLISGVTEPTEGD
jgi:integrase